MLFRFFHARPLLLGMVLFIALALGVVGYAKMPRNMYPDVERPQVTIITPLPGAAAQTVAQNVSQPIERELYTISHVRDVQSLNKDEVSIVRAEFEYVKGLDTALLDVNNALSRVRGKLPAEAPASSVYAVGAFTQPVMVLAVSPKPASGLSLDQVRLLAENDLRSALITRPHLANVEVFGGYQPAFRVVLDPLKLARYHLSSARVQEALAKLDRDWPVGVMQGPGAGVTLTAYGERTSAEALRTLPVIEGVTLGDLGDVIPGHAERYSAYHGNGQAAIALAVMRAPGGAVQAAIDDVEAVLPGLRARYPGLDIAIADTQGELIQTSNANMIDALRDAIIFTSLVILFFLGNWRAVITALLSIPLVFLSTLAILWLLGKELNILVMTGVILALGMLVDDAVVVLENIERHLGELHEDMRTAITRGTEEVLGPVFIGTLATAVVIAPLMFVGDFPQAIFQHLVLAVLIAVFTSYFIAVTFIPRLSAFWYRHGLPPKNRLERAMEALYHRSLGSGAGLYLGLLRFAFGGILARRLILLLPAFALLVFSARTVIPLIGRDALPPMDTGLVRVHVKFGSNEPVQVAEQRLAGLERQLMEDKRVERVSAIFGSEPGVISLGSGQQPSEATLNITFVNRLERAESSWRIENDLRRAISALPGVTIDDSFDSGATVLGTVKAPVDIRLSAEDWRLLPAAAAKVKAALATVPGVTSVSTTWDADTVEAHLVFDEQLLRAWGLTPDAVVAQLPLKGQSVASASKLPTVSAIPVQGYFTEPYRSDPDSLALLPIALSDGSTIALGDVARIERRPGLSLLTSDNLHYTLDVQAYRDTVPISVLSEQCLSAAQAAAPAGIEVADRGDNEQGTDSSRRMLTGLAMGILLLFGVLAPAYGSLGLAVLSVLILPLSAIGAIWGLLAFDKALALPAILGVVLLFSIVIKNSILMVDFIQVRRRAGQTPIAAAEAAIGLRYRPILMTALGTIAGMVPIAMQRAVGLERLSPLADAAIGGLLVGTILSLFYLPMFYVWMSRPAGRRDKAERPKELQYADHLHPPG